MFASLAFIVYNIVNDTKEKIYRISCDISGGEIPEECSRREGTCAPCTDEEAATDHAGMEVFGLLKSRYFSIISKGKEIVLNSSKVLYILMTEKIAEIHISDGGIYETRMTLGELSDKLGNGFIKIHRGCLVAVSAIYDITDQINLNNGEALAYTQRKKKQIIEEFLAKQETMIRSFSSEETPTTPEEYHMHYSVFDTMPIAFADIEMLFNEKKRAVDWIFRYGNSMLAKVERVPLERLLDSSFASLFSNMDAKWLRAYERAVLYEEILEVVDYSPEIDTWLKVICFPTFKGHCGCILFDLAEEKPPEEACNPRQAWLQYLGSRRGKLPGGEDGASVR